jgi:hypothetical protein
MSLSPDRRGAFKVSRCRTSGGSSCPGFRKTTWQLFRATRSAQEGEETTEAGSCGCAGNVGCRLSMNLDLMITVLYGD